MLTFTLLCKVGYTLQIKQKSMGFLFCRLCFDLVEIKFHHFRLIKRPTIFLSVFSAPITTRVYNLFGIAGRIIIISIKYGRVIHFNAQYMQKFALNPQLAQYIPTQALHSLYITHRLDI